MKRSIRASLIGISLLATILAVTVVMWFYYAGVRDDAEQYLHRLVNVVGEGLHEAAEPEAYLREVAASLDGDVRLTWIAADGRVLYESSYHSEWMENHRSREEVRTAIDRGEGVGQRTSETLQRVSFYYARQLDDGSILRGAIDRAGIWRLMAQAIPGLAVSLLLVIGGCVWLSRRLTTYVLTPLRDAERSMAAIVEGKPAPLVMGVPEIDPIIGRIRDQQEHIARSVEALREERNTTRTMMNALSEGVLLLDEHLCLVEYNCAAEMMFDIAAADRGRPMAELLSDEDWRAALLTATPEEDTTRLLERDGRVYRLIVRATRDAQGRPNRLIVLRDTTTAYTAEQQRREFTANVSHELNTPLTAIHGFAELLYNGMYKGDAEVKNFAQRMLTESDRLLELIRTVMRLSRIEEDPAREHRKRVSLRLLTEQARELLERSIEEKRLTFRLQGGEGYLWGDPQLLYEMVLNLLDNAVKYNRPDGYVEVRIESRPDAVDFIVRDSGIGISKEQQEQVFQRFYRADVARSKEVEGSGLGLAIVKHIVRQHDGTIVLTSTANTGTTMHITLPVQSPAVSTEG